MKKLLYVLIFHFIFIVDGLKSQESFSGELQITNYGSNIIKVKIYPVSCVFNGDRENGFKYNLFAKNPVGPPSDTPHYSYINGRNKNRNEFIIPTGGNNYLSLNHDNNTANGQTKACVGYGVYKLELSCESVNFFDTCTIEWDAGYPSTAPNWSADLSIIYRDNDNNPRILFQWSGDTTYYPTSYVNKQIVAWDQQYSNTTSGYFRRLRNKDFGNFFYDTVNNNNFSMLPQDSRRDCESENQVFNDNRSGVLTLNLVIDKNIVTRDTLIENPTNISITKGSYLKLNLSKVCSLKTSLYPSLSYNNLIIEDSALLYLSSNSIVVVGDRNRFTLKDKGQITLWTNAKIVFKAGSLFCNEGGKIKSAGSPGGAIVFDTGFHYYNCSVLSDLIIKDSTSMILESGSVLLLPNNKSIKVGGYGSKLILKSGSKILLGENSSVICDSGGSISAINATFASSDSTKKWNGISLSDLSQDTIRNCTIKNAMYGIVIYDKYYENDDSYSTEISNCNFINQTGYVLNNAVYISGSNNVLIMNNTLSSTSLQKGFTHGIYAEYCPEGNFNIIGNNIAVACNGMTLIGCSPFVAQNIITGNEYSECGLFLDNSNGTFEYNVISDFYCSYFSYYSSPDLLKNVFDNYYDDNIWLSSSSVPVMHPLINGSSVFWYAGDNLITGSPSNSGILFEEDANPLMNYGYNRFEMTNNDYYIQGINPSGGGREFFVIQNYWGGTPDPNKFDVANADVIYIPYDNNSSQARATNSDSKFDIGFGLYDTVYYYEPDNPNSAQDLYLDAYQKESAAADSGDFSQAIYIYKEIFKDYKDSSYASYCLSRIYGCFEKKNSTQNQYSELESYYENIQNDTAYSEIQRNIAEEFNIKTKVKQHRAEEAVSDYTEIYNQNTGTPKGMHAFINKEILSAGMGDNPNVNSQFDNIQMKMNTLSQIFAKIIKKEKNIFSQMKINPEGYSLSQNYPNPFNPVTTISFSIPENGYVKMTVYDILGREVRNLVNETMLKGTYSVSFVGSELNTGVYFYKIDFSGSSGKVFSDEKKMIVVK